MYQATWCIKRTDVVLGGIAAATALADDISERAGESMAAGVRQPGGKRRHESWRNIRWQHQTCAGHQAIGVFCCSRTNVDVVKAQKKNGGGCQASDIFASRRNAQKPLAAAG